MSVCLNRARTGVSKEFASCARVAYVLVLEGELGRVYTIGSNSCASTHTYVHCARAFHCTICMYILFSARVCSHLRRVSTRDSEKLLRSAHNSTQRVSFMSAALLQFADLRRILGDSHYIKIVSYQITKTQAKKKCEK